MADEVMGGWTRCVDALPDDLASVWAWIESPHEDAFGKELYRHQGAWCLSGGGTLDTRRFTVKAWHPIPPPYAPPALLAEPKDNDHG